MRTYVSCLAILCAMLADAYSNAHAASKMTVKRDDDKTITVYTRALPPLRSLDFMITNIRTPAPPNACDTPTSSAFEIVTRDVVRCVGKVNKP